MTIILWLTLLFICFIMLKSLIEFVQGGKIQLKVKMKESRFSTEIFYTLLVIYLIFIIGFGMIYFILSIGEAVIIDNVGEIEGGVFGLMLHSLYFSGATLLTVGYGDVSPIGIGRFVALLEALIGYLLPTAFVLQLVQKKHEREKS